MRPCVQGDPGYTARSRPPSPPLPAARAATATAAGFFFEKGYARAMGRLDCATVHAAIHAEFAAGAAREATSGGSLRLYLAATATVSISAAAALKAADIARHALLGGGVP